MASLGSEVGRDDPAEGSPLVGLAGSLPTLTICPLIYYSRRSETAQRRDRGDRRAAARRRAPGATTGSRSIRLSVIVSHIVHRNYLASIRVLSTYLWKNLGSFRDKRSSKRARTESVA